MRAWRIHYGLLLVCVLLVAGTLTAGSGRAQSEAELKALNQQLIELRRAGKYGEAITIAENYVTAARKRHGERHPVYAAAVGWLALLLKDTNRYAEAEPLYRRALAIDEKSLGPAHPDVATRLNNLAGLLEDTNGPVEAEPLYRRALAIDEKSLEPEHPKVAICLNNLAGLQASCRTPVRPSWGMAPVASLNRWRGQGQTIP